jgi:hypothetical protein
VGGQQGPVAVAWRWPSGAAAGRWAVGQGAGAPGGLAAVAGPAGLRGARNVGLPPDAAAAAVPV